MDGSNNQKSSGAEEPLEQQCIPNRMVHEICNSSKCAPDNKMSNIIKPEEDNSTSNICDLNGENGFSSSETAESPSPEITCLEFHEKEGSLERMMSECSSVAQHIKETINKVLLSRECPVSEDSNIQSVELMLQENIQERIADLEKVIQTSTAAVSFEQAVLSSKDIDASETEKSISEDQNNKASDINCTPVEGNEQITSVDVAQNSSEILEDISAMSNAVGVTMCTEQILAEDDSTTDLDSFQMSDASKESSEEKLKSPRKNVKESASNRRKNEKSLEHVMKSLASYGTADEKLDALYKKHVKLLEELRTYESKSKQNDRQILQLTREKEQLQSDHNRTVLAKSRLESLCRELQRQNKAVKEESLLRIREEEEKRKEVASKFQATLNDISTLMQENHQRNAHLREENTELAQKLKALMDHYEKWEKHMEKVVRQKELEAQLAKAKYAKITVQQRQEREQFLLEKKKLLESVSELQKRCTDLTGNEVQLRTELGLYTSKYEEFQSVLNKSNEVFSTFKDDMANMSKKIKKLEKETGQWKTRWENSNRALLEMAADKQQRDRELIAAHQKLLTLEKLCRALQGERIELQNKLKQILPDDSSIDLPLSSVKDASDASISTKDANTTKQTQVEKL